MKRLLFILAFVCFGALLHAQSYKVIVNSSNNISSVSKSELSDLFLKKKAKWTNGQAVSPVDQSAKASVRESFSQDILGKSVGAIKSYWQQFVFAGKGTPPVEKNNDSEVLEYVKNNAGAVGYVSSGANTAGVNVISVN